MSVGAVTQPKYTSLAVGGPIVMPAKPDDAGYVVEAFKQVLSPYYGGDHAAHAKRLLRTHLAGGSDPRGLLSDRQLLLILWHNGMRRGVLNLVFKRQATCKISPLILYPVDFRSNGLGVVLLHAAEQEARMAGARQLYCTVASSNRNALEFFSQYGFIKCGEAHGQYKEGETEVLLTRPLTVNKGRPSPSDLISVFEVTTNDEWEESRKLLLEKSQMMVDGGGARWIDSLRTGTSDMTELPHAERRDSWIYCARDRSGKYRAATPIIAKKGGSLKVAPIAALDAGAFHALIIDLPSLIAGKGRKAYMHHSPTDAEVTALQHSAWTFEALIPSAYRDGDTTQQWGCPLGKDTLMRTLRIQPQYLRLINSGEKTLEIRVGYDHIKTIKPGTVLKLISNSDSVMCEVRDVRVYPDLKKMIENEEISDTLPGVAPQNALKQLRKIYPPTKEQLGIYVLQLQKC
jgi:ASC-1-like (ASCH) protein